MLGRSLAQNLPCAWCQKPIKRYMFQLKIGRAFCSLACSAFFNNRGRLSNKNPKNWCKLCNKFSKGTNSGVCQKCKPQWLIDEWIRDPNTLNPSKWGRIPVWIRRYLFLQHSNKCSKCGWCIPNLYTKKVGLQIHHKNGNVHDRAKENLELLCPNCHSLTGTFGSLNMGRGRDSRGVHRQKRSVT